VTFNNVGTANLAPSSPLLAPGDESVAERTSGAGAEPLPVPGSWDPRSWTTVAARSIDRTTLAAEGVSVPEGANLFAARIVDGGPSPAYALYEAGGGAFSTAFYPASAIKVLAAVGALELAHASGFTGEALVDGVYALWEYYDGAIRYSSNADYDTLVRIAGLDWLNERFLPSRGYHATRIQEAYAGGEGVAESPAVELTEGGRELLVPERHGLDDYGCGAANCSTLFELADSVRRVVLHDELPPEERFAIAPADVAGLQDALLGAESWIGRGVEAALGPDATVYSKPGWTTGYDCVDVGLVVDEATSRRYLVGVSAPDDGECGMLATIAADVLTVLAHEDDGRALHSDGTTVEVAGGRHRGP
jgi:hypothetical protein